MNNSAAFFDLDGTIIKTKSGKTFPQNIYDFIKMFEDSRNSFLSVQRKTYNNGNFAV